MGVIKNESVSNKLYCVYRLINHSKKEIYHGIAIDPKQRYEEHSKGNVEHTSHWDFEKDNIEDFIIHRGLKESDASSDAHYLESNPHSEFPTYKFLHTAGL